MSFRVELAESGKYIRVDILAPMTRKLAAESSLEAAALGRAHDLARFLFDVRTAPNVETILSNYQYAYEDMTHLMLERRGRSAVLVADGDHSHDFVETVVRNAGYNVRIFHDEAAAIEWLEAEILPRSTPAE